MKSALGSRRDAAQPSVIWSYLSLFTSVGTLLCCALPALLVLLGLGATVAGLLSAMPWLVTLSRHKLWVFVVSGALIALSFAQMYVRAPRLRPGDEACPAENKAACVAVTRFSRTILWAAGGLYAIGFFVAYVLGPILSRMDR